MQHLVDPDVEQALEMKDDGYYYCPVEKCQVKSKRKGNLIRHIAEQHQDYGGYFEIRVHREAFARMLGGFIAWAHTGDPGGLPKEFLEEIQDAKIKLETFTWALFIQKAARIAQLENQLKDIDAVLARKLHLEELEKLSYEKLATLQSHVQTQIDIELKQIQANRKTIEINPAVLSKQIIQLFTTAAGNNEIDINKLAGVPDNPQHRAQLLKLFQSLAERTKELMPPQEQAEDDG